MCGQLAMLSREKLLGLYVCESRQRVPLKCNSHTQNTQMFGSDRSEQASIVLSTESRLETKNHQSEASQASHSSVRSKERSKGLSKVESVSKDLFG